MPLNKGEAKEQIKIKLSEIEDSVNSIEIELMKEEGEFAKHILGFHLGRLQQQFIELNFLFKENLWT